MLDINTIVDTLVAIGGTFAGLSPIIVQGFKLLKQSRVGGTIKTLEDISMKAVTAAAQVGVNLSLDNSKMYNFAFQALKNEALQHGIKIDDARLQMYIESAYKELSKDWADANTTSVVPTDSSVDNPALPPVLDDKQGTNNIDVPVENPVVNSTVSVPQETMSAINNAVLQRATNDAELAVKNVINTVQQAITVPSAQ